MPLLQSQGQGQGQQLVLCSVSGVLGLAVATGLWSFSPCIHLTNHGAQQSWSAASAVELLP